MEKTAAFLAAVFFVPVKTKELPFSQQFFDYSL